jgi:hypothetical protein
MLIKIKIKSWWVTMEKTGSSTHQLQGDQCLAWGYHSICCEMLLLKYNFFLDEMICLCNKVFVANLSADGHKPNHAPPPTPNPVLIVL